ncbi:MAG TPA: signal peptidase I [Thermomicrobiales bacterium]|nr:signal peptidase I [Thermomicrobiales bacterium]
MRLTPMTLTRRGTSYAVIASTLFMFGLVWLAFAPAAIGGNVTYVIVNGNSMEPGLRRGDLVMVRQSAGYEIGDVVTYRHPTIGPVIHRIVDRDGDRFILQGDNNDWLDSYNPNAAEIAGAKWLHIPAAGAVIAHVRNPRGLTLVGIILAGVLIMTASKRHQSPETRRDTGTARPAQLPTLDGGAREAAGTLALLALACLVLVAVTFTRPERRPVSSDIAYQQSGAFSYTAEAPAGIYDDAAVTTGAPVFLEVTERVTFAFDYRFFVDARSDVGGVWSLAAVVSNSNGWQRTLPLSEPGTFSGAGFTASGELDLIAVQQMIDSVVEQTGVRHDVNTIVIRPRVELTGSVAGQPVQDTFAPELIFRLDAQHLRLVDGAATERAVLEPVRAGLLTLPGSEPNSLTLLGWELSLSHARTLAVAGLALCVGLLGWLLVNARRVQRDGGAESAAAAHDIQLIEVTDFGLAHGQRVVTIASVDDFALLAARAGSPVLLQRTGRMQRCVAHVGEISYEHLVETPPVAGPSADPSTAPAGAGAQA